MNRALVPEGSMSSSVRSWPRGLPEFCCPPEASNRCLLCYLDVRTEALRRTTQHVAWSGCGVRKICMYAEGAFFVKGTCIPLAMIHITIIWVFFNWLKYISENREVVKHKHENLFSQWQRSFQRKLRCHWLQRLQQRQKIQGPGISVCKQKQIIAFQSCLFYITANLLKPSGWNFYQDVLNLEPYIAYSHQTVFNKVIIQNCQITRWIIGDKWAIFLTFSIYVCIIK